LLDSESHSFHIKYIVVSALPLEYILWV